MNALQVSVVVPTFRDGELLQTCLAALEKQTLPREAFEVIVVDNDPSGTRPPGLPERIRYAQHPRGYSYAARNAGLLLAGAEVLAFTDADCIPDEFWLEAALQAFDTRAEQIDLVAGAVEIDPDNPSLVAQYDRLFGIPQERFATVLGVATTANLLVRRAVFTRAGLFDEELESGGDVEFCKRAARHGFRLFYAADAKVWHPARDSLGAVIRKNSRMARGLLQLHQKRAAGRSANLRYALHLLRPRLGQWWAILSGKLCPSLPLSQRLSLAGLRILFHYHLAACQLRLLLQARSRAAAPG